MSDSIENLSNSLPNQVRVTSSIIPNLLAGGSGVGQPSYFDLEIEDNDTGILDGAFDFFCLDTDLPLGFNAFDFDNDGVYGEDSVLAPNVSEVLGLDPETTYDEGDSQPFSASVYSSYDPAVLSGLEGKIEKPENLDLVNWILNNTGTGEALAGYTVGEIQLAIWELMDNDPPAADELQGIEALFGFDQAKVDEIKALAQQNGDGFVPQEPGDKVAVILVPDGDIDGLGYGGQIIVTAVELSKFPASLGDKVFYDDNGDGIQDAGEAGVEGVTVTLTGAGEDGVFDTADDITDTTTTDADGMYEFTNLNPGEYKVTFDESTLPEGFEFTDANQGSDDALDSDADPTTGMTESVTLAPGENNPTLDAGIVEIPPELASLGDKVFFDDNGDGIQDAGEAGVEGVTVTLTGGGVDGVIGTADDTTDTTTTDADGMYSFTNLNPGEEYKVTFSDLPEGFEFTDANQGSDDALDSDADPTTGMTQVVTLAAGENNPTLDAGIVEIPPELASLGDKVFFDDNGDGIQDAGEAGVEGVTVTLTGGGVDGVIGTADDTTDTTTTDADGMYSFTNLNPGEEYKVTFSDLPEGFEFTDANQGSDDALDSDADPTTGMTQIVTLAAGENNPTLDAGIVEIPPELASLGDKVFFDDNGDGIQDAGEAGVEGVTVTLTGGGVDGVIGTADDTTDTTTTDADGMYSFTNLNPGEEYKVTFSDLPEGFEFTDANQGSDDALDSDADPTTGMTQVVTLAAGENNPTLDAGIVQQPQNPGIEIEKSTNGVNADTPEEAVEITAGEAVTWTYEVTNTGDVSFDESEVVVTDDQEGAITNIVDQGDGDNILAPGETWIYEQTGVAQQLTGSGGAAYTFDFGGSSGLDGPNGNVRTFNSGALSVNASAFSRDQNGNWDEVFLGSFSSGLGVTDNSEGNGGNGTHRVDNVSEKNYILFEFSEEVVVDRAFMNSVINDSDITYWVGTQDNAFNNHNVLSDNFLSNLAFTEDNYTNSSSSRWADINAGEVSGNVLVIAAATSDPTPEDRFKLDKLDVQTVGESGIYQNIGTVVADGVEDSDPSHYVNGEPEPQNPGIKIEKSTNGVDADTLAESVEIAAGETVTWTYEVTNTGDVSFDKAEIEVTDDQEGTISNLSDQGDGDNTLAPGETWIYEATGVAQNLSTGSGSQDITFNLTGNSYTTGNYGNSRTFTQNGVSVDVSAFSNSNYYGWETAYLGAYSGGLGVTNRDENGYEHRVDNNYNDEYIVFEFDQEVTVDRAFLNYVSGDSDVSVWIGDRDGDISLLNSSILNGFTKENNYGGSSHRWADINANQLTGNTLVIAAHNDQSDDSFKLEKLDISVPGDTTVGNYVNIGTVTAGSVSDRDQSSYTNPASTEPEPQPEPEPSQHSLLFSFKHHDTLDGISVDSADIIEYNPGDQSFSKFFDGSDVGLWYSTIDAFEAIGDNEILLSFESAQYIDGIYVDDSDLVKFTASSLGNHTSGSFSLYFDGSDVGLTEHGEDIDGLSVDPVTGDLLISTKGNVHVSGIDRNDEDILRFNPHSLGWHTRGTWSVEFDGSDVGLNSHDEDLDAIAIKQEQLLLSTKGNFHVSGASGTNEDIFGFNPNSLGIQTSGTFEPFFNELNGNNISGIDLLA